MDDRLRYAWNSAIEEAGDTWPETNAMGTIGWRRESISSEKIAKSKLASAVRGTEWLWAGIKSLVFNDAGLLIVLLVMPLRHHAACFQSYVWCSVMLMRTGVVKTPWGEGKWGLAMKPKGMPMCRPPNECLFVDFSGAAHHVFFHPDLS